MSLTRRNSNAIQSSSSRRRRPVSAVGYLAAREAVRYAWNNRGNLSRAASRVFRSRSAATPGGGGGLRGAKPNVNHIKQGVVVNEGTGGQYSMFTQKAGKTYLPPHVENALAPQVIQANGATQLKSAVGLQNVSTPLNLFYPAIATTYTGDKISRVLYDTARGDVTINNIYLSNCYVIIYDIFSRKDAASGSAISSPSAAWGQGDTDESNTPAITYLGSSPWQSEAFNQFYRVAQVTNIVLGAGATHVHKVRLSPKRVIPAAYAYYSGGMLKDLTYWCMVEIHGSPANDTTTQTQVSVGVSGINIVNDQEHVIKQLLKSTPTITTNNGLLGSFTVGEQVVNTGGSTVVAQAEG